MLPGNLFLETLELNTSDILVDAADRYNWSGNLLNVCNKNDGGSTARISYDVHHSDKGIYECLEEEYDLRLGLSGVKDKDWYRNFQEAVRDATNHGIIQYGLTALGVQDQ